MLGAGFTQSFGIVFTPLPRIESQLSINHVCHVATLAEELHHLLANACHLRPPGFRIRVLLQSTNLASVENEVHLPQTSFGSPPDDIQISSQGSANNPRPLRQSGSKCRKGTSVRPQAIDSAISAQSGQRETRTAAPSKLGNTAAAKAAVPFVCPSCTTRINSRTTTTGVSTTARAKLNISARDFATPNSIPTEIVAPDRENPRNGKQSPCTAPIIPASLALRSVVWSSPQPIFSSRRSLQRESGFPQELEPEQRARDG